VCRHPTTTLVPGQSVSLDLTLDNLSLGDWARALNCARIDRATIAHLPQAARRRAALACAFGYTPPPKTLEKSPPPRLQLEKRTKSPVCTASGVCTYTIEVTNVGGSTYRGPLAIDDQMAQLTPKKLRIAPAAQWTCQAPQVGKLSCRSNGDVVLPPKATTTLVVEVTVDPTQAAALASGGFAPVTNCAALRDPAGGTGPQSCATAKFKVPNVERPATPVPPVVTPPPVPPVFVPPPVQQLRRDLPPPPPPAVDVPACEIPGQVLNVSGRCVCEGDTAYDPRTRSCTGARRANVPCPPGTVGRFQPDCTPVRGQAVDPRVPRGSVNLPPNVPEPQAAPRRPGRDTVRTPTRPSKAEPTRPSKKQTERPRRPREVERPRPSREQQRRPSREQQRERPRQPDVGREIFEGVLNGLGNGGGGRRPQQQEPLD
jgi:hypothetical protein